MALRKDRTTDAVDPPAPQVRWANSPANPTTVDAEHVRLRMAGTGAVLHWMPQADMTAQELGVILPVILYTVMNRNVVEIEPWLAKTGLSRHFYREEAAPE